MGRVYGHMSLAVLVSMLVSYFVGTTPELLAFFFTGVLKWIVIFAPLVIILAMTWIMQRATYGQARGMLHIFAALMGLSMSTIFITYEKSILNFYYSNHISAVYFIIMLLLLLF